MQTLIMTQIEINYSQDLSGACRVMPTEAATITKEVSAIRAVIIATHVLNPRVSSNASIINLVLNFTSPTLQTTCYFVPIK